MIMVVDIAGDTVNVIMADDMPIGMHEHVWKNADDSYTVKLNAKYDQQTLQDAFEHAVKHIRNNDWEKDDVQLIEAEAHGLYTPEPDHDDDRLPDWLIDHIANMATAMYYGELIRDILDLQYEIEMHRRRYASAI